MKVVATDTSFPKMEEALLAQWEKEDLFNQQEQLRKNAKEFAFYDGPPFANGLPHYGHLLANTIKDVVPRYWLMKGFRVRRRFGWDCHGLPVEFEIEKREGLKGRPDILKLGVDKFNETCRESVLHYANEWQKTITRLGRFVDWSDPYRTMDKEFMESVWWVFSELYKKGLVYQGFKVVPYSPRTTSVVSNFEANRNYKSTQDPAIVVKFKLLEPSSDHKTQFILAWTTTPWTLPANLSLGIGKDISYVQILDNKSQEIWTLAEERLGFLYSGKEHQQSKELPYKILATFKGNDLVGKKYEPLFPFFTKTSNAFQLLHGDFVSTGDGVGIVHLAPAYGEDDFFACKEMGIPLVDPIDENGCFDASIPFIQGQYFKDADKLICKALKEEGKLLRHDTVVHSYPFDERTDTPLMYKAVPSWYVAVEKFVPQLVNCNQQITWVPHHLKDGRMGNWLASARDWAISRNRFWGTPIPVWVCEKNKEHVKVISSIHELEMLSKQTVTDLHKHFMEKVTISCETCNAPMRVVDQVFDCWFESGSMPYAQLHYPFENKERFAESFPADFVAEGLDQTRGWFYTLNVLSTALFNKPAFKNVIVNGVILDESGKKMSKRHRNYTPPDLLVAQSGADSVRLYMLNSPLLRGEDLIFNDKGVKEVTRAVLLPLWNAYSFLATYAQADNWQPSAELASGQNYKPEHEMDEWLLSRLYSLVESVNEHMGAYKLYLVVPEVLTFIEELTNWYIRLSRRRFWGTESGVGEEEENPLEKIALASHQHGEQISKEQKQAYETLFFTLLQFSKILAPFAPFISDILYRNLIDGIQAKIPASVHLVNFPVLDKSLSKPKLEEKMELIRKVMNLGRSLRAQQKLKIRQPLASMLVITRRKEDQDTITWGMELLKSELNIKEILFTTEEEKHVNILIKPNLKTLGKKLGAGLKKVKEEIEMLSKEEAVKFLDAMFKSGTSELPISKSQLTEDEILIERSPKDSLILAVEGSVSVLLDTRLTPELILEGNARDLVNRIQNLRKESKLDVSDRIHLEVAGNKNIANACTVFKDYICKETLAIDLHFIAKIDSVKLPHQSTFTLEDEDCMVAISRS